jgi:Fe-S-cluster containining protein
MDAARLRQGLARIADRSAAARIQQRAVEAVEALRKADYPGDLDTGTLDPLRTDELFHREPLPGIPCPALDLETGACELYQARPVACRTYGPAVRLDGRDLPHCPLNYQGATTEQIEACRVTIDPGAVAQAALAEFLQSDGEHATGETVVAFALASYP